MIRGKEEPIEEFLSQIDGQLFIPIYQRKYTWKDEQRDYFWRYLINIDENSETSKHYLHAILTKEHGGKLKSKNKIKRISIIDGQQRILTSVLLYCAICAFCKNHPKVDFDWENEIYYKILIRPGKEGDEKYKIIPKDVDEETFKMIVDDLPMTLKEHAGVTQIIKTYNFFLGKLTEDNVESIYFKFAHFCIGNDVAEEWDNAQILFETINFAGTPLKDFEMVRCYTLMNENKELQEKLYYEYWYPLSQRFNEGQLTLLFKTYTYYYFKRRDHPGIMRVLESYKSMGKSNKEFLKDISKFASKFEKIINCNTGIPEVDSSLSLLNLRKTVIPVSITLYELYLDEKINLNHFIKCMKLIETTFVRLTINDSTTAGSLMSMIFSNSNFTENAFNEIMDRITYKTDSLGNPKHIISDNLFKNKLLISDFYKDYSLNFVRIFLKKMNFEGDDGKDYNLKKYEVEHILPQNLNEYWKQYLGENWEIIVSENCNRLGNLTLIHTNKNKWNSNKSFEEKLKKLIEDGIFLNKDVIYLNHWNQDTIQTRTESMAKMAVGIWSYPTLNSMDYLKNQSVLSVGK